MSYKTLTSKDRVTSIVFYLIGIFGIPLGIALSMHAHLGVAGVDSLSYAIAGHIGISVSIGVYITTFLSLITGAVIRKSYPRIQCYITSLIYGFFQGLWDSVIPTFSGYAMPVRLLFLFVGIAITAFTAAFYLLSRLPVNPNDDLLLAMREKGLSVTQAKLIFEVVCFILAFIAGGEIGIGTVAFLVFLGPMMGFWTKRIEKIPAVISLNQNYQR